jgi:predicted xylose isomerase-like sugar epimerase
MQKVLDLLREGFILKMEAVRSIKAEEGGKDFKLILITFVRHLFFRYYRGQAAYFTFDTL